MNKEQGEKGSGRALSASRLVLALFLLFVIATVPIVGAVSYIDPQIADQFLNGAATVNVLVLINDTSTIAVNQGTPDERLQAYGDRTTARGQIVAAALAQLPSAEFTLMGKLKNGEGFNGYITSKGFDILLKIPEVDQVFFNGPYNGLNKVDHSDTSNGSAINGTPNRTNPVESTPRTNASPPTTGDNTTSIHADTVPAQPSWFARIITFLRNLF